ncbi:hypothetical protein LTR56_015280 [Elasticomyces elasticus]|nr:hypothetical protein LTR56_015280 [Elasticomyces elasticus]KAK3640378.1 hypothetical protein LTR22_017035 [Elasticomyces elasticus]KAK4913628.1 hypothetical protein LTR49_018042 [Elasticomyces elasticus]KAK5753055.1 hypothetical protein LTS12_016835 [Elasticomyces elasticus]
MAEIASYLVDLAGATIRLAGSVEKLQTVAAHNTDCTAEVLKILDDSQAIRQHMEASQFKPGNSILAPASEFVDTLVSSEQQCRTAIEELAAIVKELETKLGHKTRFGLVFPKPSVLERLHEQVKTSTTNLRNASRNARQARLNRDALVDVNSQHTVQQILQLGVSTAQTDETVGIQRQGDQQAVDVVQSGQTDSPVDEHIIEEAWDSRPESNTALSSLSSTERVRFGQEPKASRPLLAIEAWSLYHYETHARQCDDCYNTLNTTSGRLCATGTSLARDVAEQVCRLDGNVYSRKKDNHKLVQVELPPGYTQVPQLLTSLEHAPRTSLARPVVSRKKKGGKFTEVELPENYNQFPRPLKPLKRARLIPSSPNASDASHTPDTEAVSPIEEDFMRMAKDEHEVAKHRTPVPKERRGSLYYSQRKEAYEAENRQPNHEDVRKGSLHDTLREPDIEHELLEYANDASDTSSNVSATDLSSFAEPQSRRGSNSVGTMPTTIETRVATEKDETDSAAEHIEYDQDDVLSIRTDARDIGTSISQNKRRELAVRFAAELLDNLRPDDVTEDVLALLPEMLFDFSKVLDHKARGGVQQKASIFVRHHRKNIVQFAREHLDTDMRTLRTDVEKFDINSWAANVSGHENETAKVPPDIADLPELDDIQHNDGDLPADIGQARTFLLMGTEFQWLLNRIKTLSTTMETGRERLQVHKYLVSLPLDRHCSFEAVLDWDPLHFLEQQYKDVPDATISTSITYNGTGDLVEAVGCKDYISRARTSLGRQNSMLELSISRGTVQATIKGDLLASVEAIEVLAWLGAACRASPEHAKPMYCSPDLTSGSTLGALRISFLFSDVHPTPERGDIMPESLAAQIPEMSLCWMQLVKNPVIVKGYPVSRRYDDEKGLEIEVGLMTILARASRATVFDGVLVLQGLYSMLVAVAETTKSIMWHYLLGQDGGRVCYSEALRYCEKPTATSFRALEHARHFVGWTRVASVMTGTKNARYEVGYAGGLTEAGCVLENVTIGVSKIFAFSAKLSVGSKDMRHASPMSEDYKQRILQLEVIRVVFYDTSGKRAWMVNGADALLHITRAYLTSPHAPPARHHISERLAAQFVHRKVSTEKPQKAYDVLCDPSNLKIRICPEREAVANGETPRHLEHDEEPAGMCLENLVAHFGELLWEMRGHQHKVQTAQKGSVAVPKWPFMAKLEGFGFADVVSLQPLLQPRFAELNFFGPSWLKATDLAGTINIIGSGFGELIMSRDECQRCTGVPPGRDFLTTSTELLRRLAEYTGGDCRNHLQLGRAIFWNKPDDAYGSTESIRCRCDMSSHGIRCGVIVTPLMSSSAPLPRAWEPDDEETRFVNHHPHAAVILGDEDSWRKARSAIHAADRACIACKMRAKKTEQVASIESRTYGYPTARSSASVLAGASVDSGYGTADPSQAGSASLHEEGLVVGISHEGSSLAMPTITSGNLESGTQHNLANASARPNPRRIDSEGWVGSTVSTAKAYNNSAPEQIVQCVGSDDQTESMGAAAAVIREQESSDISPGSIGRRASTSPRRLKRSTRNIGFWL